jgi:hypothetical protein
VPSFLCDRPLLLRVRYYRQGLSKLRLVVPGRFGRKGTLNAPKIASAVRTKAFAEAKRVAWKTPPRAKLSVAFLFFSDDRRSPPAIHKMVKFYLDVLKDIAFADDRQISHLTAGLCRLSLAPRCPNGTTQSDVVITVERLVDYNRRFDLCFDLSDRYGEREREGSEFTFDLGKTDESLLATFPEETRRQIKKLERDNVQNRLLSHSKLGHYDRPGVHRHVRNLMPTYEELRKLHPLVIDLGNLPQRDGDYAPYTAEILTRIQQFKKRNKILSGLAFRSISMFGSALTLWSLGRIWIISCATSCRSSRMSFLNRSRFSMSIEFMCPM